MKTPTIFVKSIILTLLLFITLPINEAESSTQPQRYYYWILYSSTKAQFSAHMLASNDIEADNNFKNYCERANLMQYNRRVEGPFQDAASLQRSRSDAKKQWQNSGFQVSDWTP